MRDKHLYTYKVLYVNKVIDGDTVDVTIDLGFNLSKRLRVRCLHYDAPEMYRATPSERTLGLKAKSQLESLLYNSIRSGSLYLRTYKDPAIYGRWLGEFITESGTNLNLLMKEFCESLSESDSGGAQSV